MNENDGTRSFDTLRPEPKKPTQSLKKAPDLKKIITISIFAVLTAIILLFCGIIIAEVAYKFGADVKYTTISVPSSDIKKGDLLIVNKANGLDASVASSVNGKLENVYRYNSELKKENLDLVIHYGYRDTGAISLLPEVIEAFNRMTTDLYKETDCDDILLAYGHLTPKANTLEVDYPHQLGTTLDIKLSVDGETLRLSKNATVYTWLLNNAHKYGFVNSDPNETVHGTDELVPSTQFRYIGIPHATYIAESETISNFEQYVAELRNTYNSPSKPLIVESGSNTYSVYYVTAAEGDTVSIQIPENYEYSLSGDNSNGFIVTVHR